MIDDAGSRPGLRLTLLGEFRLRRDGVEIVLPGAARRLVALLALSGRPTRGAVAGELWPDTSQGRAQGSLRSTLHRLRPLCPELVRTGGDVVFLDDRVRTDVAQVVGWARSVLDADPSVAGRPVPDGALGELLPGWYDDWVLREREQLRQLRMHALEQLAEVLASRGRFGEALHAVGRVVRLEPLRESARRTVVRIHLAEGNAAEALREFDSFERLLVTELGVSPSHLMTRLVENLRSPRPRRLAGDGEPWM